MKKALIVMVFLGISSLLFAEGYYAGRKASLSVEILRAMVNAITGTATVDFEFEVPLADILTIDAGMMYYSAPAAGSYFQPSVGFNIYITDRALSGFWMGLKYAPMLMFGASSSFSNTVQISMGFKLILNNYDGVFLEPSFGLNWQIEKTSGQQAFPLFMFRVGYIF